MTKMAAMAINKTAKTFINFLLQNQKDYDFETCLQKLYKLEPLDDLDLFYSKVKIGRPDI